MSWDIGDTVPLVQTGWSGATVIFLGWKIGPLTRTPATGASGGVDFKVGASRQTFLCCFQAAF